MAYGFRKDRNNQRMDGPEWISINANQLTGDGAKAWAMMEKGREGVIAYLEKEAKARGALPKGKKIAATFKGWGLMFAVVDERGTSGGAKSIDSAFAKLSR